MNSLAGSFQDNCSWGQGIKEMPGGFFLNSSWIPVCMVTGKNHTLSGIIAILSYRSPLTASPYISG